MTCPACGTSAKRDKREVTARRPYGVYVWEQCGWLCECGYLWAEEADRKKNETAYRNAEMLR